MKIRTTLALTAAMLALAATGHAHPGHSHDVGGIGWGLAHPFTGIDHLLAAFAVGMIAALWRRVSPVVVFLAAGLLGGFAGAKFGAFTGLEAALAISACAFGISIAFGKRALQPVILAVVGLGAAAHGWAHGSEVSGTQELAGIFIGTAAIVGIGAAVASMFRPMPRFVAGVGATIAVAASAIMAGIL